MKPLAVSVWQLTAMAPMHEAGGRLFVDVTRHLASPASRAGLLDFVGRGDPLIRDALETVLDRGDFVPTLPDEGPGGPPASGVPAPIGTDPAIVTELIERSQASIAALRRDIRTKTGPALFDFLLEAFQEHKRVLSDPLNLPAIMAGMEAPGGSTTSCGSGWARRTRPTRSRCPPPTTSRWRERPTTLVPVILDNVRNFEPGTAERRFDQGRQQAEEKEQDVLERLRALPDGEQKADETKRMIDQVRAFIGYREYPKYGIVSRYFIYKQALLEEAERLVQANVLPEKEDSFYLTFQELHDVARSNQLDDQLIQQRKDAFGSYHALTPPRVLTSDGEAIAGTYRRDDVPTGALIGLPVSAGTVEGRARVILDMAEADLEPGDILVTAHTDPSWSPLFVGITGLVTEVGGLMTDGAVIAREYGLPAVVGVEQATRLIRDRQRIRVHGTDGYVEILP